MASALLFDHTVPKTLVHAPTAVGVIQDVRVKMLAGEALLDWVVYFNGTAASAGMGPIDSWVIELTEAEKQRLKARFTDELLAILAARPEFAGAVIV